MPPIPHPLHDPGPGHPGRPRRPASHARPGLTLGLCALLLAGACTTQTVSTTNAPAAASTGAPATTAAGLLGPTNAFRASQGLPPLRPDPRLDAAALAHARDMAANGFFAHAGSDGSTVSDRARVPGCTWTGLAENIASGQTSPEAATAAWINSPGHRRNHGNQLSAAFHSYPDAIVLPLISPTRLGPPRRRA